MNRARHLLPILGSWLLPLLCAFFGLVSLTTTSYRNIEGTSYICVAAILGGFSILKNRFFFPAYMVLTIGMLNLLISTSDPWAKGHSATFASVVAIASFSFLLLAMWKPLLPESLNSSLPARSKEAAARTIPAMSLSLFAPLICVTLPLILSSFSGGEHRVPLFSWDGYSYALL